MELSAEQTVTCSACVDTRASDAPPSVSIHIFGYQWFLLPILHQALGTTGLLHVEAMEANSLCSLDQS